MHSAAALAVAALATFLLTPVAMRVAVATRFYDLPAGYKGHRRPTPYLGGAAITAGVVIAVLLAGDMPGKYLPIVLCATVIWLMGTVDDKVSLPILLRVAVEVGVGVYLAVCGLGWNVFYQPVADGALTVFWVLGVMNAFNLMDNMDGAAATTAAVSLIGVGTLGLISQTSGVAPLCFATAGACIGFLPRNLSNPAKIFMGDGGSLTIGLIVAAGAMSAVNREYLGPSGIIIGALLVGLVIFDTTLVVVSRTRAGRSVFAGGRDHTTHRLAALLGSARHVAGALAGAQLMACVLTIGAARAGRGWVLLSGAVGLAFGVAMLWKLETAMTQHVGSNSAPSTVSADAVPGAVLPMATASRLYDLNSRDRKSTWPRLSVRSSTKP